MAFWLGGGSGDGGGALQAEEEPSLLPQVESGDCILENSFIPVFRGLTASSENFKDLSFSSSFIRSLRDSFSSWSLVVTSSSI